MLVYAFAHVDRPFEEAEPLLVDLLRDLGGPANDGHRDGGRLRVRVGLPRLPLSKSVRVHAGVPLQRSSRTVVPLRWEATGPRGLFPRMEADLILEPLGAGVSHLAFNGSYDPPLGRVGAVADALLLHRVADGTAKRFVDCIRAAIGIDQGAARS
jgi:hypothetical protein